MITQDVPACRFRFERLLRLSELENWHFWFVGRRLLVSALLKKYLKHQEQLILDLGCGTGLMTKILMRQGHRVVGLDLRPEGLYATRRALPEAWLIRAEAPHLPFTQNVFDAVMLLDVLEHVDDEALLTDTQRVLQAGGLVVITVPSLPWLWSYRDEAAGHLRRYKQGQLMRVLTNAGLQVEEMRHYQFSLLPLIVIARLFGRRGPKLRDIEEKPFSVLNKVMTLINRLEVRLSDIISWPWGSSLVAICRKI